MPTSLSISQIFDKLNEFCQLQSLELDISSNPTVDDTLWPFDSDISADVTVKIFRHLQLSIYSNATEDDALVMRMRQLIEPGSSLRGLVFRGSHTHNIIPILLGQSSLEELTINSDYYKNPNLLPQKNTNLKKLVLICDLFPLAKLLPNYTSLTCLIINKKVHEYDLFVLFELIQSHPTLEVLGIQSYYT